MIPESEILTKQAMDIIGVKNPYIMYLLMKVYDIKKVRLEKIDGKHHAVYLRSDVERLKGLWNKIRAKKA